VYDTDDSTKAIGLFKRSGIEYVEYDIRKFEEAVVVSCLQLRLLQFLQLESLKD